MNATIPEGFKVEFYLTVGYSDFDRFVTKEFGQPFEFAADQESGNDQDHSFAVTKSPLSRYEDEHLKEFRVTGRYSFLARVLLQDMVNRDVLPEGNYLIQVSW